MRTIQQACCYVEFPMRGPVLQFILKDGEKLPTRAELKEKADRLEEIRRYYFRWNKQNLNKIAFCKIVYKPLFYPRYSM